VANIPTVKEYRKLNLSEEQAERFLQDIKTMEVKYQGRSYDGWLLLGTTARLSKSISFTKITVRPFVNVEE
jgi:hypothetical protein